LNDFIPNINIPNKVILQSLSDIWNFRVATIDNNDVTVANIIIALIIFTIGFGVSKKFSKFVVNSFTVMKTVNENTKATIEYITFYCLLIIFIFTSLAIAQIPLKSFALLGGALAIGFGFGSQNVIKNFISGLILMVEQPIRVGDIINVEGTDCRVLRIGARSTHIRTFENVDILVPNSNLLENNVVNWTFSDDFIRTSVSVGVAYGTDTRKVEKILIDCVSNNPHVINERAVIAFFNAFGDNSLNFEVQFWCKMPRPSEVRAAESEVRHDINEALLKEGIVISFQQRDVHLDTLKPLDICIVDSKK
jgi:potassium efflux system protein